MEIHPALRGLQRKHALAQQGADHSRKYITSASSGHSRIAGRIDPASAVRSIDDRMGALQNHISLGAPDKLVRNF
jgi:hypothetical protein